MKVVITTIGLGGWYPRGIARMISRFHQTSPGFEITAWVNTLPFGAPADVIEDGYDYTAYCAKPFALLSALVAGADIAILLDAAFYPIRPIHPLIEHIAQQGYYFCRNGNQVGEWASDRCLERMNVTGEDSMQMEEISSYCVGLNFSNGRAHELLHRWCGFAADRLTIPGRHTNSHAFPPGQIAHAGRNAGFVSSDPRVKGHRHDQTVLSILAHQLFMENLVNRPKFTAYLGSETDETVLVNHGGL